MNHYFATVARGLEAIATQELEGLGAQSVRPDFTGVHFAGDASLMYRVNLWSRTIFRVLLRVAEFPCPNAKRLYQEIQNIQWEQYLKPHHTLAVRATGGNQQLNHTHFTALQVKNGIIDQQRHQFTERSSIDTNNPDVLLNVHIHQNHCILSLDSSGTSLHRRGYRPAMGLAPLKETLAAALLEMADWQPTMPFFDPLCGSGTLPLEASLKALNIAPGLFRNSFGFERWLDFDPQCWEQLLQEAKNSQIAELKAPILGSDRDSDIIKQARINAENCGVAQQVTFNQTELSQVEAPAGTGIIICNPPYGERVGNANQLGDFYKLLGDVFKQQFKGWTAFVLCGNKELAKRIGLKASRRIPVYNGSIPCTLLKYELY